MPGERGPIACIPSRVYDWAGFLPLTGSLGSTSLKTSFWTICLSWKKSILQGVVENDVVAPRIDAVVRQVLVSALTGRVPARSAPSGWIVKGQVRGFGLIGDTVS